MIHIKIQNCGLNLHNDTELLDSVVLRSHPIILLVRFSCVKRRPIILLFAKKWGVIPLSSHYYLRLSSVIISCYIH